MKEKKNKISIVTYIMILLILAFSAITVLIICGRMDAKEKARLDQEKVQEQSQTL